MSEALKRDYEVCEEIGRGRFGVVSRCISAVSGESFAVKAIDKRLLHDAVDRRCIDMEVKATRLLSGHPNIVSVYDVYEDDHHLHLVFELCDAPDLYTRFVSAGVFSEVAAASVALPLMHAVAHCHRRGIAHRDIKPDNILFDHRNRLKLADFGSAELIREGEPMSGVVGTPYYVAPEVITGGDYDEKVDIWSVGVILYLMLAGTPPFYGDSVPEIFEAVLKANLRFPFRLFHSVSPAAKDLLRRMLCKDVSKRFSAEQVLRHPWMVAMAEETRSATDLT